MVDYFGGTFIIFVFAIFEVIAVVWVYGTIFQKINVEFFSKFRILGLENFCDDLEFMLKMKVSWYWRWTWGIITPLILIVVFIYFVATLEPLTYGREDFKLEYPSGLVGENFIYVNPINAVQIYIYMIQFAVVFFIPGTLILFYSNLENKTEPDNPVKFAF